MRIDYINLSSYEKQILLDQTLLILEEIATGDKQRVFDPYHQRLQVLIGEELGVDDNPALIQRNIQQILLDLMAVELIAFYNPDGDFEDTGNNAMIITNTSV